MIKDILEELDRNGKSIRDDISDGIKILLRNKSYMKNAKEFHGVLINLKKYMFHFQQEKTAL